MLRKPEKNENLMTMALAYHKDLVKFLACLVASIAHGESLIMTSL
jgi:hypothetical protein